MAQQQTPHPITVACAFLQRADIKGSEVDAYAKTYNWLQSILLGELVVLTAERHKELLASDKELQESKAGKKDTTPKKPKAKQNKT